MNTQVIGLLVTFLLGLFILIGVLIAFLVNKKGQVIDI